MPCHPGIRSGLAVLFSTSSSNPGNGQGELVAGHELEFFWECLSLDKKWLGFARALAFNAILLEYMEC
jgi:hypothetical protein